MKINKRLKSIYLLASTVLLSICLISQPIYAVDESFYSGNDILFYDPSSQGCSTSFTMSQSDSLKTTYTLEQVRSFAGLTVDSTWNIPDKTAEEWFLKQAGAKATINRYQLNSSNISTISSAVKENGVSPAFFYAYTVNEGGGAGGFINHYASSSGSAVSDAKRDAEYIVSHSKSKEWGPATEERTLPGMPTTNAAAFLESLPLNSIGVIYVQATAAVTAEIEDLSGNTGSWSGKFGKPITDTMKSIVAMGGDPMEGGTVAGDDCANNIVAGEGIQKAINWAKMIANNDGYGYDQPTRTSGWAKYKSDPNCTSGCGNFDCSSFVAAALTEAGYFTANPQFSTYNQASELQKAGFKKVITGTPKSSELQPGDILLNNRHTEMYIGDGQKVGAHSNERNGISGGAAGDQTGNEISINQYTESYDWAEVWRATK